MAGDLLAGGTIVFKDNDKVIGQAEAVGTAATLETDVLAPGPHAVTAVYANNGALVSGVHAFDVAKATTKIELVQTLDTTPERAAAIFLAKVTSDPGPVADSGKVVFKENGAAIGEPVALKDGVARLELTTLGVGTHGLTAAYQGTDEFTESTSNEVHHTIEVKAVAPPAPPPPAGDDNSNAAPAPAPGAPLAAEDTSDDASCATTGGRASAGAAWLVGLALFAATRRKRR